MALILAPNRSYTGVRAGVSFTAGVAHTSNPTALAYFAHAGYSVLPENAPLPKPVVVAPGEEPLRRVNGEPYSLAVDGSIEASPFAPGAAVEPAPRSAKPNRKPVARRARR